MYFSDAFAHVSGFLDTALAWQRWAAPHWTVPGLFSALTAKVQFTRGHNWTFCATSVETELSVASQNILDLCFYGLLPVFGWYPLSKFRISRNL